MIVKNAFLFLLILILSKRICAQTFRLSDIIVKAYSKPSDLYIVKGVKLNYILPRCVSFLDTHEGKNKKYPFEIIYYDSEIAFDNYLKKNHDATVMNVSYDKLGGDSIELTLEISETKDDQYFGVYKFFTFIDKRRIKLFYNKKSKVWEYLKLIKIYDEPQVGKN